MLSLLILLILAWSFYIGYNRGIILQVFYSVGAVFSFIIASNSYQKVAEKISLWIPFSNPAEGVTMSFYTAINVFKLSSVYYAGVSFCTLFFLSYLLVRFLGIFVHFAPLDRFESRKTNLVSGLLAILVTCLFLELGLSVLATVPMPFVQNTLASSGVIKFLVNHFPIISGLLSQLWVA